MTATVDLRGSDREAWLAERRTGLGSSDAAAIAGLDPYRSALAVYLDKIGMADDEQTSDAIRWGNRLEAVVADAFAEETGWDTLLPAGMCRHPANPWMVANIDRWLVEPGADGPAAILEVKTAGHYMADRWEQGPPDRVIVQVQHQLAVCGLDRAFVAVLIGGRDFRTFEVPRDDELIDMLVGIERAFWQRVENREPPAPDASESASESLRRLYADMQRDVEVELPAEARPLIEGYRTTKRMLAELKEDERRQANAIKALIGEAHVGLLDGQKVVTWSRWTQQRLDRDRLEADHPHLVAEYLVTDDRDRLTLTKKGQDR